MSDHTDTTGKGPSYEHDARNMLITLKGLLNRIASERNTLSETVAEWLDSSLIATDDLARIITNSANSARDALTSSELTGATNDMLSEPILKVGRTLKVFSNGEQGAKMQWNVFPSADADGMHVHTTALERALQNVMANAIKYATAGTVSLHLSRAVKPRGGRGGKLTTMLSVCVMDTGPGFSDSALSTLFDNGPVRPSAARDATKGWGVGLGELRRFLVSVGGGIRATNRADRTGAMIEFWLPAHPRLISPMIHIGTSSIGLTSITLDPELGALICAQADEGTSCVTIASPEQLPIQHLGAPAKLDLVIIDGSRLATTLRKAAEEVRARRPKAVLVAVTTFVGDQTQAERLLASWGYSGYLAPEQITAGFASVLERVRRAYIPRQDRVPLAQFANAPRSYGARELIGRTILVAEDNPDNLEAASKMLRDAGARVYEARSAGEAIRFASSSDVDAILCDFYLGDLTGDSVAEARRTFEAAGNQFTIPICMMTAEQPGVVESKLAPELGILCVFQKPLEEAAIVALIVKHLGPAPSATGPNKKTERTNEPAGGYHALDAHNPSVAEAVSRDAEAVACFVTNCSALSDKVAGGNWDVVFNFAHNLKSSAGILGASDVLELLHMCTQNDALPMDAANWASMVSDEARAFSEAIKAAK